MRAGQVTQFSADQDKGVRPRDWFVAIRSSVVGHRLRQPALVLECEVTPVHQLGNRVGREEFAGHALASHLPCDVLDAVLADVHVQALAVVRPGTPGAIEAAVLVVHTEDGTGPLDQLPLLQEHKSDALCRAPGGRRMVIVFLAESTRGVRPAPNRGPWRGAVCLFPVSFCRHIRLPASGTKHRIYSGPKRETLTDRRRQSCRHCEFGLPGLSAINTSLRGNFSNTLAGWPKFVASTSTGFEAIHSERSISS